MCSLIARGIVAAAHCATVPLMTRVIRALDRVLDAHACDAIVSDLPAWFGNPEGIAECSAAVRTNDGLVAVEGDGDPGPEYAATRAFYLARGFRPMAELDIWGPENPCQLLGRRLTPAPG